MSDNPLGSFFRRPAIYVKLPSRGNYYPPGTIDLPDTGDIPVYPMTAIDEITYRTPDALFNGQAVVDVIQSCIPNIKNAWGIPTQDLDLIMIAIRIASYGHTMDIDTKCPKCGETSTFEIDLRTVLDNIKNPDFDSTERIGDLEVFFKPLTYKQLSENSMIQYEEQKLLTMLEDNDALADDEKLKILNNAFRKVSELTVKAVRQGIKQIRTPDTVVTDPKHIDEFLHNCDSKVFDRLVKHIQKLKEMSVMDPLKIKCPDCGHEYQQPFTFDMSNFFESAS